MYACIYIYIYIPTCTRLYIYTHIHIYIHTHIIHIHTHMHVFMHTHICTCTNMQMYTHIDIHNIYFMEVLLYMIYSHVYGYIWYIYIYTRGTGAMQSHARLEKPGGATRQGCGLGMSVSKIVHDRWSELSTQLRYSYRLIILL